MEIVGSFDVSLIRVEGGPADFLQVRGLGANEELIDLGDLQIPDQTQVDAHPHAGQQEHRFFAADLSARFATSRKPD